MPPLYMSRRLRDDVAVRSGSDTFNRTMQSDVASSYVFVESAVGTNTNNELNRTDSTQSIRTTSSDSSVRTPGSSRDGSHNELTQLDQPPPAVSVYANAQRHRRLNGVAVGNADTSTSWRRPSDSEATILDGQRASVPQRVCEPVPSNYKTEMCKHYANDSRCPRGSRCLFAHGEAELRGKVYEVSYSNQPCAGSVRRSGEDTCQYEDTEKTRCNYAHPGCDIQFFECRYTREQYNEYQLQHFAHNSQPYGMFM